MGNRILIVGGCHVDGFKVQQGSSFPTLLKTQGRDVQIFSYAVIGQQEAILSRIRESTPDWVVLQLGNYEFPRPLVKQTPVIGKPIDHAIRTTRDFRGQNPTYRNLTFLGKILFDRFLGLFGHTISVRDSDIHELVALVHDIRSRTGKQVLVLSPFPSLDAWVNRARSLASNRIRNLLDSATYLDLFLEHPVPASCYADPFHFNEAGHALLAGLLHEQLGTLRVESIESIGTSVP